MLSIIAVEENIGGSPSIYWCIDSTAIGYFLAYMSDTWSAIAENTVTFNKR